MVNFITSVEGDMMLAVNAQIANQDLQLVTEEENLEQKDQNIQYNRILQLIAGVYVAVSSKICSIPIPGDDSPTIIPEYYRNLHNINPDIPEGRPPIRRLDPHPLLNMNVIYGLTDLKNTYRCQIYPKSVNVFLTGFQS
ncbi:MAG: hypothetical protein EZS28_015524 [Streblomastix strix]|uniref:Uncharacterized protein n=1 Tax=Streblomastix strix TaxID=222440 RepID=A0A5J4W2P3_9EUKA|nr:MAG: hypothetical protein EZS28_015524 [Streblomastix strix]